MSYLLEKTYFLSRGFEITLVSRAIKGLISYLNSSMKLDIILFIYGARGGTV